MKGCKESCKEKKTGIKNHCQQGNERENWMTKLFSKEGIKDIKFKIKKK